MWDLANTKELPLRESALSRFHGPASGTLPPGEKLCHRKGDSVFVGQCCVHDTRKDVWEVGIELLSAYRGQGYGKEMLTSLIAKMRRDYGQQRFCACVAADNVASIALMRSVGGVPDGIRKAVFFRGDGDDVTYEERHLGDITPETEALAAEFGVEPRRLLSHALVFRLDAAVVRGAARFHRFRGR
jgi:GNAT superfamily N-acetyltransferase